MRIEFGGKRTRVTPVQLEGEERAQAWQRITAAQPRYAGYERKTDRSIAIVLGAVSMALLAVAFGPKRAGRRR